MALAVPLANRRAQRSTSPMRSSRRYEGNRPESLDTCAVGTDASSSARPPLELRTPSSDGSTLCDAAKPPTGPYRKLASAQAGRTSCPAIDSRDLGYSAASH